jgi:hypothetical protein
MSSIMSVSIKAMGGGTVQLAGDVTALIRLPARAVAEGFAIGFSDGTLIRGGHDIATGRCRLALATEGAAMVRILSDGDHDRAQIDWSIEWATLACGNETVLAGTSAERV